MIHEKSGDAAEQFILSRQHQRKMNPARLDMHQTNQAPLDAETRVYLNLSGVQATLLTNEVLVFPGNQARRPIRIVTCFREMQSGAELAVRIYAAILRRLVHSRQSSPDTVAWAAESILELQNSHWRLEGKDASMSTDIGECKNPEKANTTKEIGSIGKYRIRVVTRSDLRAGGSGRAPADPKTNYFDIREYNAAHKIWTRRGVKLMTRADLRKLRDMIDQAIQENLLPEVEASYPRLGQAED